jgi:hypothetical protein
MCNTLRQPGGYFFGRRCDPGTMEPESPEDTDPGDRTIGALGDQALR